MHLYLDHPTIKLGGVHNGGESCVCIHLQHNVSIHQSIHIGAKVGPHSIAHTCVLLCMWAHQLSILESPTHCIYCCCTAPFHDGYGCEGHGEGKKATRPPVPHSTIILEHLDGTAYIHILSNLVVQGGQDMHHSFVP